MVLHVRRKTCYRGTETLIYLSGVNHNIYQSIYFYPKAYYRHQLPALSDVN